MPIYEYQCTKCKRIVEVFQRVNDLPPKCHGAMIRLVSKSSFILKGTGWFKTDYKDKPNPNKKEKGNKDA